MYGGSSRLNRALNNASKGVWPAATNNYFSGNKSNVVLTDIFLNYIEGSNYANFPNLDLHIKSGSVAKNAGTDGKDIGIYGGSGFRGNPSLPYIEYKDIAKQTNPQGQLPVNIKVKAQGN